MNAAQWVAPVDVHAVGGTAESLFRSTFGGAADGVWAAPGRVNLIGEHVDYAGGLVLPFALPYVTVVAVRARGDGILRAVSTHTDESWQGSLAGVGPGHPSGWAAYVAGVVWALRRSGHLTAGTGFDVAVHSTVPVGSGLSSSAALECAFALAVADLAGLPTDESGRRPLITASILAENEIAGASTGGMDQSVAMLARPGHAVLLDCRDGASRHVPLDFDSAGARLVVIDTNAPHRLVDGRYGNRRAAIEKACADLGVATLRDVDDADTAVAALGSPAAARARHVLTEIRRVTEVAGLLDRGRIADTGDALNRSHASLRDDYEVSSVELDSAVDAALAAGAWGARMTGGGFGGSAIALVPADRVDAVAENVVRRAESAALPTPQFLSAEPSGSAHRL
ncbi:MULTISPECIES: galactokinase [unclassified Rhodococcus (in: high G+C Gram-positive bacteria)]|uniref:galactokinase n=1 Tax=unclassified Rhodococcus (in: high G+C Gram-positive bacteria) TaxID=192944 RepID=UPI00163A3622|nr:MULTISPECIES: galactokinase [unclassified Rhodococcus (in: high G+C Gram-positive bacteria)]MBC2642763.1 galactokinase [Rhodococcus sp. 3A]MBC2892495.1 galactokinase [Rhodococcus sp. 4CII]